MEPNWHFRNAAAIHRPNGSVTTLWVLLLTMVLPVEQELDKFDLCLIYYYVLYDFNFIL